MFHLATYLFCRLDDLSERARCWREELSARGIYGTLTFAPEGINVQLAGSHSELAWLRSELERQFPGILKMENLSSPDRLPFRRLRVVVSEDLIPGPTPLEPAPSVSAKDLALALAGPRPPQLIDTRNQYEWQVGSFSGALCLEVDQFRDFVEKLDGDYPHLRTEECVIFCTGGIRCEKVGAQLRARGWTKVRQLEGGILRYLQEEGSGWTGECFLFDQRSTPVKSDNPEGPDLKESGAARTEEFPRAQSNPPQ